VAKTFALLLLLPFLYLPALHAQELPVRVLVTAYEEFEGRAWNASRLAALELQAQLGRLPAPRPVELQVLVLPVEFKTAFPQLLAAVEAFRPQVVLSLGEADVQYLKVEERARNYDSAVAPDNDGWSFRGPVVVGGPQFLPVQFPVAAVLSRLAAESIPARRSRDAGAFVCNHTLYRLLHWAAGHPEQAPSQIGFIHLPYSSMAAHDMGHALRAVLGVLVEKNEEALR
jgi:pyroglutamyl-peptidase